MLFVIVLAPGIRDGHRMVGFLLLIVVIGWLMVWCVFGCNDLVKGLFSV